MSSSITLKLSAADGRGFSVGENQFFSSWQALRSAIFLTVTVDPNRRRRRRKKPLRIIHREDGYENISLRLLIRPMNRQASTLIFRHIQNDFGCGVARVPEYRGQHRHFRVKKYPASKQRRQRESPGSSRILFDHATYSPPPKFSEVLRRPVPT